MRNRWTHWTKILAVRSLDRFPPFDINWNQIGSATDLILEGIMKKRDTKS